MLRRILKSFFLWLYRTFSIFEVRGLENVPKTGGAIVASNHASLLDAPLGYILLPRMDVSGLVAKKHHKNFIKRLLVNAVGGIWLNRDEPDTGAIRAACNFLQNGGILGIAPEGTRSPTGELISGKTGVAFLASKANVPILPLAIEGTHRSGWQLISFHRPHIRAIFGKPFLLPPVDPRHRSESLQRNTEEIMCQIAAMLPPSYWGAYRDSPRLKEILSEEEKSKHTV